MESRTVGAESATGLQINAATAHKNTTLRTRLRRSRAYTVDTPLVSGVPLPVIPLSLLSPQSWVQCLAQPVAQQMQRQHGDEDRQARPHRHPRGGAQVGL